MSGYRNQGRALGKGSGIRHMAGGFAFWPVVGAYCIVYLHFRFPNTLVIPRRIGQLGLRWIGVAGRLMMPRVLVFSSLESRRPAKGSLIPWLLLHERTGKRNLVGRTWLPDAGIGCSVGCCPAESCKPMAA